MTLRTASLSDDKFKVLFCGLSMHSFIKLYITNEKTLFGHSLKGFMKIEMLQQKKKLLNFHHSHIILKFLKVNRLFLTLSFPK